MQSQDSHKSKVIAAAATIVFHVALLFLCFESGLKYKFPPPEELGILMEFEQDFEEPKPIDVAVGVQPKSPVADPDREIELVQKSEGQEVGTKQNEAEESTISDNGDVETYEPERKKEIDKRALFSSAANKAKKDTLAAQTSDKISETLKEGHASGNTKSGATEGMPSAQLEGRQILGSLPLPSYTENDRGTVVIRIVVDAAGNVTSAEVSPKGTTTSNSVLRESARRAALKAKFSTGSSVAQEGTITYIFSLK